MVAILILTGFGGMAESQSNGRDILEKWQG